MNPFDDDELRKMIEEAAKAPRAMILDVDEESRSVELILDNKSGSYYAEWITGEGADICLYRDQTTDHVIGCRLPLYCNNLRVFQSKDNHGDPTV